MSSKTVSEKNNASLSRYEKQLEQAMKRKERSERAVIRSALVLSRARAKVQYIKRQTTALLDCIEAGKPFRVPYQKKSKSEREIQFD